MSGWTPEAIASLITAAAAAAVSVLTAWSHLNLRRQVRTQAPQGAGDVQPAGPVTEEPSPPPA